MKKSIEFEDYRIRTGRMGTQPSFGANGAYMIPHPKITNYIFFCMVSDQLGWEHVSVTLHERKFKNIKNKVYVGGKTKINTVRQSFTDPVKRSPTWLEMCFLKTVFWDDDEAVVQFHPRAENYVNNHEFCLHLWRPTLATLPEPTPEMVGFVMPEDPSELLTTTNK